MKPPLTFRWPGWLTGSLFALVAANCFLILFVAGIDVFLGQPPQFAGPLVVLLVAAGSLALSRRLRAPSASDKATAGAAMDDCRKVRRRPDAPAYVAMTIIRRSSAFSPAAKDDRWKGTIR